MIAINGETISRGGLAINGQKVSGMAYNGQVIYKSEADLSVIKITQDSTQLNQSIFSDMGEGMNIYFTVNDIPNGININDFTFKFIPSMETNVTLDPVNEGNGNIKFNNNQVEIHCGWYYFPNVYVEYGKYYDFYIIIEYKNKQYEKDKTGQKFKIQIRVSG